jgi:peptidoglycan/xylan/chitin deacetylase (PgdA/CDA1 family)
VPVVRCALTSLVLASVALMAGAAPGVDLAAVVATAQAPPAPPPPAPPPVPPAQPQPAAPPAPLRYRPVGCHVPASGALRDGPRRREVALTFDDGPWTDTPQFLGALERLQVRATFFMIGEQVGGHSSLLKRELRDGDVLGNHTFTHPFLTRTAGAAGQLSRTSAAIQAAAGYRPCVFRPPYGDYDSAVVQSARAQGLATILWDVDPSDYKLPGTATIVSRVMAQVHPGSIVLMHDGGGPRTQTLAAVPQIVRALRARGLRPVSLVDLLGGHTVYRRCRLQCGGVGIRGPLPPGAIVQPG